MESFMDTKQPCHSAIKWVGAAAGLTAAAYGAYAGITWLSYGHAKLLKRRGADPLLDVFMPDYDVVERHSIGVEASPETTLAAAAEMDVNKQLAIRAIFKGREFLLRSKPDRAIHPDRMLAAMQSFGWGVLAELPGREIVLGGATRPWERNPVFRPLPPDEFATFDEPGYVKIVFTLRADNAGAGNSVFRTETRAIATDPVSRTKFRRYWTLLSPGIIAIRRLMLPAVKREAERRGHAIAA
jgi:hypothetical protein